jgi:hypothetical protein
MARTLTKSYWVYENWTHRYVRIHRAACGHCNDGRGTQASHSGEHDEWHGRFRDREAAFAKARRLRYRDTRGCKVCAP